MKSPLTCVLFSVILCSASSASPPRVGPTAETTAAASAPPELPSPSEGEAMMESLRKKGISSGMQQGDLAHAVGVMECTIPDHEDPVHAVAVLVGDDLVLTKLFAIDRAVSAAMDFTCCGRVSVSGVVQEFEPQGLVLVRLEEKSPQSRKLALRAGRIEPGERVKVTVAGFKGGGVLLVDASVVRGDDWPIEGRMLTAGVQHVGSIGGGVLLDQEGNVGGIQMYANGRSSSLFIPVDGLEIKPGPSIPLAEFSARTPSVLIRARRLAGRGGDAENAEDEKFLRRALDLEPRLWHARWRLGVCLDVLGRADESIDSLAKACELATHFAESAYSLGLVHLKNGRAGESVAWFDRAIEHNPEYDRPWGMKGVALHELGRSVDAIEFVKKSVELNPGDASHVENLALLQKSVGRHDDAVATLRAACAEDPERERLHVALADLLEELGRAQDHEAALRVGVENCPRSSRLRLDLALLLHKKGDEAEAEKLLKEVLEIDPDHRLAPKIRRQLGLPPPAGEPRKK